MSCPGTEPKPSRGLEAQRPTLRWMCWTLLKASGKQIKTSQSRKCELKRDCNELLGICCVSLGSSGHFRAQQCRQSCSSEQMRIRLVKTAKNQKCFSCVFVGFGERVIEVDFSKQDVASLSTQESKFHANTLGRATGVHTKNFF